MMSEGQLTANIMTGGKVSFSIIGKKAKKTRPQR